MRSRPSIEGLKLGDCCLDSLKEISDKIKLGKVLAVAMSGGLLVTIFAGRGQTAQVGTLYNVSSTDWDLFGNAIKSVPTIAKNRCQQIAGFEALKHAGGDLNKFWRAMYDYFS